MPTSANVSLPLVPPPTSRTIHASTPPQTDKRTRKEDAISRARTSSSEWVDIDEDRPRRRRKAKRTSSVLEPVCRNTQPSERKASDLGRFFPRLSQILETSEVKTPSRSKTSDIRPHSSARDINRKRSALQKQDSLLSLNASLLSVISDLTAATSRSSGSNSTITQRSYSRRGDGVHRRPPRSYRRTMSEASSTISASPRARNLYELSDAHSILSSSTASGHRSEEVSSDNPETPSSSSTFPSPATSERRHDLAKQQLIPIEPSVLSSITGSEISETSNGTYESSTMDDRQFFYREPDLPAYEAQQPLPAPMPAHPSAYSAQYFEEMHRPHSQSSVEQDQALQHYYSRPHIGDEPEQALQREHYQGQGHPPAVPEAPNLAQVTVGGYEKLARELSKGTGVRPLYRKFEYLNHRILLHLQDELAELEEQLRRDDEIIAQLDPASEGKMLPSSRRGDAYYGLEIHHRRTVLLGRIFMKTEQYNKAMSAYSTMLRDCSPAKSEQIVQYQDWMKKETPIHEIETHFLASSKDLVAPGGQKAQQIQPLVVAVICSLVAAISILLITAVPSITGRLASTLALATVTVGLRMTTSVLQAISKWDTVVFAFGFVLIMSTVAVCMP